MRLLAPILSIVACLALAFFALALLPATARETVDTPGGSVERERPYGYGEKLELIAQTVYRKVLLPEPSPTAEAYSNWRQTLERTTPLLLAGLAITLAFRAGVLNIGAQGQYVVGAIAGTAVALHFRAASWLAIPAHLLAAMGAGALLAAVAAGLERWRRVPVVLSTLMLNFVALELLRYLLQGPMRSYVDGVPREPQSDEIPWPARLPPVNPDGDLPAALGAFPGWNGSAVGWAWQILTRLYPPICLALGAAVVLVVLLRRTTLGFRMRVVGQNPEAARFAGMSVGWVATVSLALSGALAGLAGGASVAGVSPYVLYPDRGSDGVGFTAIAVALLGRLSPMGTVLAALFLALLSTAFKALERSDLQVHSSAAQAVQGALILSLLVSTSPPLIKRLLRSGRGKSTDVAAGQRPADA